MSHIKLTAITGLRTQQDIPDPSPWEDFYTTNDKQKNSFSSPPAVDKEMAELRLEQEEMYDDDFDDDDDKEETKSRDTPRITLNLSTSSRNSSMERLDTDSQSSGVGGKPRQGKKKKGKKLKTESNKPPPLLLYQDQLRDQLNHPRNRPSPLTQDTLSDQGVGMRRGRKLHRRSQMKKYHSLEQAVEQAGQDRLEQKFIELEELMTRPLLDSGKRVRGAEQDGGWTTKKQLKNRQGKRAGGRKEMESGGDGGGERMSAWISDSTLDDEEECTDRQAYSTLHKLQTNAQPNPPRRRQKGKTTPPTHPPSDGVNSSSHQPHHNTRLATKPPVPRREKPAEDSAPGSSNSTSDTSHPKDDVGKQVNGLDLHLPCEEEEEKEDEDDKFGNVSPRSVYPPTEMHLKYTDNPKLQEWLRRKNIEHRQARKAERTKKREERLEKQAALEEKAAHREKSSERVKQWMDMKRKEAAKKQKEERRRRRQEAQEQGAQRAKNHENGIGKSRLDRPQSAPSSNKKFTPIRRPESAHRLEHGGYMAPTPPDTKFVYKRPVSGKVRLMKTENESKKEKEKELSPEEKEKKMRMSYDAWLVTKRKEDGEKRKEAKRQEKLIRSDPEMDRLVPELAARRVEKIASEKKSIDTGVSLIDDDVNKRFGGGSFGKGKDKPSHHHDRDNIPDPSSYSLTAEDSASSLAELNSRARPTAAKTRMPIPQSALSPRRPQSAKASRDSSLKVKAIMETDFEAEPNPYKLPSSGSISVPSFLKNGQETTSSKTTSRSKDDKRPDPQGSTSTGSASCFEEKEGSKPESFPVGVDSSPKADTTPRSSLVLLQQIEEAAVQSEGKTSQPLKPIPELKDSASSEQTQGNEDGETAQEAFITERVHSTNVAKDSDCIAENDGKKTAGKSTNDEQGQTVNDGQTKLSQQEQMQSDDDKEKTVENPKEKSSSGQNSGQEIIESDLTPELEKQNVDSSDAGKTNEQPVEKQSPASEHNLPEKNSKTVQKTGEDNLFEGQNSELADSPRRSMKRVSFSEDLATVFQPSSPESSSNFDDERGMDDDDDGGDDDDDDEGKDPYMSLDDVPDPEAE